MFAKAPAISHVLSEFWQSGKDSTGSIEQCYKNFFAQDQLYLCLIYINSKLPDS